jgi:copper homeostasis protein
MKIENAVFNIESALLAQAAGADRIELCDNPAEGGTTPGIGVVEIVRRNLNIDLYVMIRPRGGDFHYSKLEFEAMKIDLMNCKRLGADGVVFGILNEDGRIDIDRCRELILLARPMGVTCHRAFDLTREPMEALEDCVTAGFDRILTSGRASAAAEGISIIGQLQRAAAGRISIMAGVGINAENVKTILEKTNVKEVHFSARTFRESQFQRHNSSINLLDKIPSDSGQFVVDTEKIKAVRQQITDC